VQVLFESFLGLDFFDMCSHDWSNSCRLFKKLLWI